MDRLLDIFILTGGFGIVCIASFQIGKLFTRFRLPLITGFLFTGIFCGPFFLDLIPLESKKSLNYLNELSLAFIAFVAGSELYLKELRTQIRSIAWNTFGQLVVTFIASSFAVYFLSDNIEITKDMPEAAKVAVAILAGTIFVARSPSSAIAVINELRAKGPFTSMAIGVTVVKDVLVIILFAITFQLAKALISGVPFTPIFIAILLAELGLAMGMGWLLGKMLQGILSISTRHLLKTTVILLLGMGVYTLSHEIHHLSELHLPYELHIESLLVCIIASFYVTNYSKYREEFHELLHKTGPLIFVIFFTLTGSIMRVDLLQASILITLLLFLVRLVSVMIGAFAGGMIARDPIKYVRVGWMPFITQAGIAIGLSTIIASEFPTWGPDFATLIISVVVINEIVGPPLFKFSLNLVGEAHVRHETPTFDGIRNAIIFGMENQVIALGRQLKQHGWGVDIASRSVDEEFANEADLTVHKIDGFTVEMLNQLDAESAEAIVLMNSDEENMELFELIYEHVGTKNIVVRLQHRTHADKLREMGAMVVEPSTAMVSLFDHMVRAPQTTNLLLGGDEGQDTLDLEVIDPALHGVYLRDLRLPADVIVLSVYRNNQVIISHGYTRLRSGDTVTLVGSKESLDKIAYRFEGTSLQGPPPSQTLIFQKIRNSPSMGKAKKAKFLEMKSFPNVYQNYDWERPQLINNQDEIVDLKGSWREKHFKNDHPLCLELACGRGDYTVELARQFPEKNFIGIDVKGARIWAGAKQAVKEDLPNAAFLRTRIEYLPVFFADDEVDEIWITFPDPFRRKSDRKHRLTHERFLKLYEQVCPTGSTVHFKTDDLPLFEYSIESIHEYGLEINEEYRDIYHHRIDNPLLYIQTHYERMHLADGRTINYLNFKTR